MQGWNLTTQTNWLVFVVALWASVDAQVHRRCAVSSQSLIENGHVVIRDLCRLATCAFWLLPGSYLIWFAAFQLVSFLRSSATEAWICQAICLNPCSPLHRLWRELEARCVGLPLAAAHVESSWSGQNAMLQSLDF